MPTSIWSIGCWPRPATANAGPGTGSTWSTYGETHGYDKDKPRPNAWPYRDYVIRAFNDDKPYARFVQEQFAGDVLFPDEPQAMVATGFIAAGPWDFVGHTELREGTVDKKIARIERSRRHGGDHLSTFLSLTVHCARCHDHKFDPIKQKDYYTCRPSSPASTGPTGPTTPIRRWPRGDRQYAGTGGAR